MIVFFVLIVLIPVPGSATESTSPDLSQQNGTSPQTQTDPKQDTVERLPVFNTPLAQPSPQEQSVPAQSLAEGVRASFNKRASHSVRNEVMALNPRTNSQVKILSQQIDGSLGMCACGISVRTREASKRAIGKTSAIDVRKKRIPISVVGFEFALKIFQYLANQDHIPFSSPRDGCFARAHEMSFLLEQHDIVTAKVIATGKFRIESDKIDSGKVTWGYHLAPALVVDDGTTRGMWVLDPSLFNEPVPLDAWLKLLTDHPKAELTEAFLTSRFVYHPARKTHDLKTWNQKELQAARKAMKRFKNTSAQTLPQ